MKQPASSTAWALRKTSIEEKQFSQLPRGCGYTQIVMRKQAFFFLLAFPFFLLGSPLFSQQAAFDQFLSYFPRATLPISFGTSDTFDHHYKNLIPDSLIKHWVAKKTMSKDIRFFNFYGFASFVVNDSLVCLLLKKSGGAGGIDDDHELILYTTDGLLIDRMVLFSVSGYLGFLGYSKGIINSDFTIERESLTEEGEDISKRVITHRGRDLLKIASSGFQVIKGKRFEPGQW